MTKLLFHDAPLTWSWQVVRIVRVLREAKSQAQQQPAAGVGAAATTAGPDAYAVLGLEPSTAVAEVKKRYMRLSLLIHPDKCGHKNAHEAFQAVNLAAKVLQVREQLWWGAVEWGGVM